MTLRLSVRAEITSVLRTLDDIGREQLPFAVSKAINAVLTQGQAAEVNLMAHAFTLRRADFAARTVKINKGDFATKRNLVGRIGIQGPRADVYTKFEEGGVKEPFEGLRIGRTGRGRLGLRDGAFSARTLAIPRTGSLVKPRRTSITPDSLRAGALLRGEGAFTLRTFVRRFKGGGVGIFGVDRTHEAKLGAKRNLIKHGGTRFRATRGPDGRFTTSGRAYLPITRADRNALARRAKPQLLYTLKPSVPIDDRLHFEDTMRAAVESGFAPNVRVELAKAIQTRKVR